MSLRKRYWEVGIIKALLGITLRCSHNFPHSLDPKVKFVFGVCYVLQLCINESLVNWLTVESTL